MSSDIDSDQEDLFQILTACTTVTEVFFFFLNAPNFLDLVTTLKINKVDGSLKKDNFVPCNSNIVLAVAFFMNVRKEKVIIFVYFCFVC